MTSALRAEGISTIPVSPLDPAPRRVQHAPFTWAVLEDFFTRQRTDALASSFPSQGFRPAGISSKLFYVRSLVVDSRVVTSAAELPEVWQDLGRLIVSPAYRDRLAGVVDRDLDGLRLDASLCRYPPGCSLMPHTDRELRDTTHVVYLNREWQPEWGGMLRILRSDNLDDVIEEVLPTLPTSVVMVRSDCSWHAVTAVAEGVTAERLSLLVHASRPDAT